MYLLKPTALLGSQEGRPSVPEEQLYFQLLFLEYLLGY